ncbi:helix-turn-helix transcriptional regulator [Paracoccus xiamenensis]|uniref:helix-turn-helix transcriptional regulator n=1 Tax=Paracoccus xiamenensis TaxID=2714901 RepID=UPI00140D4E65|nr:AraC family transcriptional regulator [Paracoccus xiamenensis]NHF74758.1 AraC family transcriptional regulator [Paracoccus xiamenensis]
MPPANTHFAPVAEQPNCKNRVGPGLICVEVLSGIPQFVAENFGSRVLQRANQAARLEIDRIEGYDCFIPHRTLTVFIDSVARQAGEHHLGLRLVPYLSFDRYRIWAGYVLGAQTLHEALERTKRSVGYHSFGDRLDFSISNGSARVCYFSTNATDSRYQHEGFGTAGVILSIVKKYISDDWVPTQIELNFPKPANSPVYEDIFGCPVLFDRPVVGVVFPSANLTAKRRTPNLPPVTIEDLSRERLEPCTRDSLMGAVKCYLRTQILSGRVDLDRTAFALDISKRTLQRELNREGFSFRDLVTLTKCQRASELLRDGNMRIGQVSSLLGYSSSAHFARAFRKHSGMTPAEYSISLT